tara:strand:- start:14368 stop:16677 length:2310 start_codon:yes stop_codon:yes gene_type:complete
LDNLPLTGLQIVELPSGLAGAYCGRLFSQYGAQVTKINSLKVQSNDLNKNFEYLNIGKKIVDYNFNSSKQRRCINSIIQNCDVLIHSSNLTSTQKFDFNEINNPKLISISISDTGSNGPLKNLETTDLILQATSGIMSLSSSQNGIPIKIPGNTSYFHAGSYAYSAALFALIARKESGTGSTVEISVLESILPIIAPSLLHSTYSGLPDKKLIPHKKQLVKCKDGKVFINSRDQASLEIIEAIFNIQLQKIPEDSDETLTNQNSILEECFRDMTMNEIFQRLSPLGILVGMKLTISDLVKNEHLRSRKFFENIDYLSNDQVPIPGLPFKIIKSSKKPEIPHRINQNHLDRKKTDTSNQEVKPLPLANLRVVALTHTWSGALTSQLLGSLGAEVIQIESPTRPDLWRGPIEDINTHDYPCNFNNQSPYNHYYNFNAVNQNKLGMTLDLEAKEGREKFLDLVRISDIVVENFSLRVLKNLNLEFQTLLNVNPSLIMLRMPGYGTFGEYSLFPANGSCIELMTGIPSLLNYSPELSSIMHTDVIAGNLGLAAILTGLFSKSHSGKGQLIDLSQQETALSFFGDLLSVGDPQQLIENGSPEMSPHGAFKCAGNNSWIAIAIRNEEDWQTFCHVTENRAWLKRKEFSNLINRLQNKVLLHEAINNWSKKLKVDEIETLLQSASIPAIKIASISDLKENFHLKYRSVFKEISRNQEEKDYFINTPFIVNNHRIINSQKSPEFGQHNYHILTSILGLNEHEIEILYTNQITGNHIK